MGRRKKIKTPAGTPEPEPVTGKMKPEPKQPGPEVKKPEPKRKTYAPHDFWWIPQP